VVPLTSILGSNAPSSSEQIKLWKFAQRNC
jgi:hypothetical protein